jgi:type II secretion system protein N
MKLPRPSQLSKIDWRGLLVKWRRSLIVFAAGLGIYLVALAWVFPYARVGEFAEAVLSNAGYDAEIGDVGPTFGMGVTLREIKISERPIDGGKPWRMLVDRATVTTSPWVNLTGGMAYDVVADLFGGRVDLSIAANPEEGRGSLDIEDVALADLPWVKSALDIPVKGQVNLDAEVTLPKLKAGRAEGTVTIEALGLSLGDGKAKLKVPDNPMLAEGLTVPRLRLGDLTGQIVFEKGTGTLKAMHAKSPDGEVHIEGEIRLADPVESSRLDLYVRFRLSDQMVKGSDKIQLLLQFAEMQGKRPDGFFGFRLSGSLRRLGAPLWMKTSPFPGDRPARPRSARPVSKKDGQAG